MTIDDKTSVKTLREMIGVSVWVWKPPGYQEPIERPDNDYCYGIVVEGTNIIFQLSGPKTESCENVYKTESDANTAYNAYLEGMRIVVDGSQYFGSRRRP